MNKGIGCAILSFTYCGNSNPVNFAERYKSCLNSKAYFGKSL